MLVIKSRIGWLDPYGASFVTSRILSTEYNSVGQNIILLDRIVFC